VEEREMCNDVGANHAGVQLERRGGVFMKAWTVVVALTVVGVFALGTSAQEPQATPAAAAAVSAEECAA
jgi:hypothetical protein